MEKNAPIDKKQAIEQAKEYYLKPVGGFDSPKWGSGLIERLKKDGGERILVEKLCAKIVLEIISKLSPCRAYQIY